MLKTVIKKLFLLFFNSQISMCHEQVKKPTPPTKPLVECFFFTCSATAFFTPQWMVVHEQVFLNPPWTKSFAKSLFLVVHEQLYGIAQQHAFIPRWWTPPNSLADYLHKSRIWEWTFKVILILYLRLSLISVLFTAQQILF